MKMLQWKPTCQRSEKRLFLALTLWMLLSTGTTDAWFVSRRDVVNQFVGTSILTLPTAVQCANDSRFNYVYSDSWTGTALPVLPLEQAGNADNWNMARWPDPILRRPATPVTSEWFGTETLRSATRLLQKTSRNAEAVGLAAQQCGVDARIVHLELPRQQSLCMINPRITNRSPEPEMKVWREHCLVLPPTFEATVLRDKWVDVEYRDWEGRLFQRRLKGEVARAAQHELDHDRGILILDHVSLEEMESCIMQDMEVKGHDERMALAYARTVEPSIATV